MIGTTDSHAIVSYQNPICRFHCQNCLGNYGCCQTSKPDVISHYWYYRRRTRANFIKLHLTALDFEASGDFPEFTGWAIVLVLHRSWISGL